MPRVGPVLLFVAALLQASPATAGKPPTKPDAVPSVRVVFEKHETDAPVIAVCAGAREGLPGPSLTQAQWAEARGGIVHDDSDSSTRCIELPSSELPFGLWLARGWVTEPPERASASVPWRARLRLSELAGQRIGRVGDGAPPGVVIAVAGKTNPEQDADLAARTGRPPSRVESAGDHQRSERLSVLEDARISSPELHIGYPIVGASEDDLALLGIVAALLGAGDASRLPSLVVRRRGRATDAYTWFDAPRGIPLFGISVAVAPHSSIDRVERYVEGALKQLRIVGPSPTELASAQRVFENRLLHLVESPIGRARLLARVALAGGPPLSVERLLARSRAASVESIRDIAKRYLLTTRRSVVEVYPPEWAIDDVDLEGFTLHTVAEGDTWQTLAERFGVPASDILRANELDARFRPTPGEALWIPPAARER